MQYWEHIRAGMLAVLARDARVAARAFTEAFTREQFVSFVFRHDDVDAAADRETPRFCRKSSAA